MIITQSPFRLGSWNVKPADGVIENGNQSQRLQPRVMELLCRFAETPGELLSREQLIADVWEGRAMSDEPLHRCIAELRAALGDDCNAPRYIETLPRRGYRLVADVTPESCGSNHLLKAAPYLLLMLTIAIAVALAWRFDASAQDAPRLLVLPLKSISSDSGHQLLADGLTDELINSLQRRLDLAVMSRTTTFSLREENIETLQLRQHLNVAFLVEGHVRIVGDSVRITAQLVDGVSGEQITSQVYTQPVSIVGEVLDAIADTIARDVGQSIVRDDAMSGSAAFPAYRHFLEAQYLWQQDDAAAVRQAIVLLEFVIEAEPTYAAAHANLAAAYYTLRNLDTPLPEYDLAIHAHVADALKYEPLQPLARALDAVLIEDNNPVDALMVLQDVVQREPTLLRARRWYAQMLYRAGYLHEAIQHMNYIYERDPLAPGTIGWLADITLANSNFDAFQQLAKRTDAMKWRSSGTLLFYGALRQRDKVAAAVYLKKLWAHSTRVTGDELQLIVDAIFDVQLRPEAIALVHDMLDRDRPITRFWGIVWLDLLGDHDAAIDLQLAENHPRDIRVMYSVWHLEHRGLRRHPRFMQLIEKFRLQEIWAARGGNRFCKPTGDSYRCE